VFSNPSEIDTGMPSYDISTSVNATEYKHLSLISALLEVLHNCFTKKSFDTALSNKNEYVGLG